MKFTLPVEQLAVLTATASRSLPSRPPIPVLAGLLLDVDADGPLSLSAFDYEVSTQATDRAEVGEPGRVLVSGRLLGDITKTLPKSGTAQLELDGVRLVLTCGSARFTLPTLPVEEYPALPALPARTATVDGEVLADAVAQVAVAAGRDDTLPQLTGVYCEFDQEQQQMWLAATDRYRFAVRRIPITFVPGAVLPVPKAPPVLPDQEPPAPRLPGVLIPARTLADTVKTFGEQPVDLAVTEGLVALASVGLRCTTRLLEGEFPRWRSLVPSEFATTVVVDRDALADVVARVAVVAASNTPVRLRIDADAQRIWVQAGSGDDAQGVDETDADVTGADLNVAFNPAYLRDALRSFADPKVRIGLPSSTKPALLTGVDQGQDDPAHFHILMPVRLSG
ncbi:DNA polymerase III subunit beta [Streptacidiphilus sp. MAP5-52]|uniref:DNA polymerase III subunit beta n=1 Tax=Streptacidiphilus sp. MAP5-52 TaxID=3156267 RepID=UPI003513A3E5